MVVVIMGSGSRGDDGCGSHQKGDAGCREKVRARRAPLSDGERSPATGTSRHAITTVGGAADEDGDGVTTASRGAISAEARFGCSEVSLTPHRCAITVSRVCSRCGLVFSGVRYTGGSVVGETVDGIGFLGGEAVVLET